jgi:GT2 family glycosyltransferase
MTNTDTLAESPGLPPTSLIICSRNRTKLLWDTVNSVLAGGEVPAEMVIVDQSDTPNPYLAELQQAKGCQVRYLRSHSIGLCKARNLGIATASHDILAFIDDDMCVNPEWFGFLIRALIKAGPKAVITGKVLPGDDGTSGGFVPALVTDDEFRTYSGRIGKDVLAAGHMAMFRSANRTIGDFDERLGAGALFPAADDNDYGFRLLEAGFHIIYTPQAIIYHRAWRSSKDYFPMRWSYGRGKGGFYTKYFSLKDRYILKRMSKDVCLQFFRFPWRVLHKPRLAIGDLYYAAGIIFGAMKWLLLDWTDNFNSRDESSLESLD